MVKAAIGGSRARAGRLRFDDVDGRDCKQSTLPLTRANTR